MMPNPTGAMPDPPLKGDAAITEVSLTSVVKYNLITSLDLLESA
jgi:hypothetical protein